MDKDRGPYSVHSFMLPLRWDSLPEEYSLDKGKEAFSFDKRTDLKLFLQCICDGNSSWERRFFRIDSKCENFNEIHYFHAYATKTLFDLQQVDEKTASEINASKVMIYLELKTDSNTDTYTIRTLDKEYRLVIDRINLHVYNTGVAILTLNLQNRSYDNKEDILKINEYGRRMYPQFLDGQSPLTTSAKKSFLADSIEISIAGIGSFKDDFSEYDTLSEREVHHYDSHHFNRSWVVKAPSYIRALFNDKFSFILAEENPGGIRLNLLTDDRMFFQSWLGNNQLAKILGAEKSIESKKQEYTYLSSPYWYSYVFGDKTRPSIANKEMQKEHAQKHTYARWVENGTLFGFSRDSFVAISPDIPTLLDEGAPNLCVQMKTMYYQMAVLCLAQRVSVLRFSAEVSNLTDITNDDDNEKLIVNIKILYKNYIEFINKIYFREITPYIQGIEMYSQFQDIMQIEKNVKDLDGELNELFNYIKLEQDEKQSREAGLLNRIAVVFLPASLAFSIMGSNFLGDKFSWIPFSGWSWNVVVWVIIGLIPSMLAFILLRVSKKVKSD